MKTMFLILFSLAFTTKAQSNLATGESEIFISYGNTVIPEQIGIHKNDSFKWQVTDEASTIIADETQGSFFSYVFSVPGTFYVEIISVHSEQNHVCSNHGFSGNWKINVSPVKMSFDVESIAFSAPLQTENLVSSIEISLPVNVSFYDSSISQIAMEQVKISFQGVDCNVHCSHAHPEQKIIAGQSLIHFIASGSAPKGSFIMLDFIDHNGLITTYYHPNEL
jgi:hypothetical protein